MTVTWLRATSTGKAKPCLVRDPLLILIVVGKKRCHRTSRSSGCWRCISWTQFWEGVMPTLSLNRRQPWSRNFCSAETWPIPSSMSEAWRIFASVQWISSILGIGRETSELPQNIRISGAHNVWSILIWDILRFPYRNQHAIVLIIIQEWMLRKQLPAGLREYCAGRISAVSSG